MSRSTDAQSPDFDETTMRAALELALRAPSLHNSQPWRWRLDGTTAYLYLDSTRRLPATDPHARELVISCGAALHHLQVALAAAVERLGCAGCPIRPIRRSWPA